MKRPRDQVVSGANCCVYLVEVFTIWVFTSESE